MNRNTRPRDDLKKWLEIAEQTTNDPSAQGTTGAQPTPPANEDEAEAIADIVAIQPSKPIEKGR